MNNVAIDFDDHELRLVVGGLRRGRVVVTDAAVLPLQVDGVDREVGTVLKQAISQRALVGSRAMIAIGRGRSELRKLQLPPVPEDDLPEMVRFQAIRSFASSGESAVVDFLITEQSETGIELIAAATSPKGLAELQQVCRVASLEPARVALRPASSASLYLANKTSQPTKNVVLVDLLGDDAEIVVTRGGNVIYIRSVRMPPSQPSRGRLLVGEIKRSLVACGGQGPSDQIVLWGKESADQQDRVLLADAFDADIQFVDPFDQVAVDDQLDVSQLGHVGRLAPLVGLLAADQDCPDRLIDFLNPRQRPEVKPNRLRTGILVAVPVMLVLALAYLVYDQITDLNSQIASLTQQNSQMKPAVDAAIKSIARTEQVDEFLDGNVQWLDEIQRLAQRMPGSDRMIVESISAVGNTRQGGGQLVITGRAVHPDAIDSFERSLRDDGHMVLGDGANEDDTGDTYRWGFQETISVAAESIRNRRYKRILEILQQPASDTAESSPGEVSGVVAEDTSAEASR